MPQYDAVRRRLIVCCDGTWQSSVSGERNVPSNVTRLCRHLARSQEVKEGDKTILYNQMVFYDPGIGTGDLSSDDANRQGGTGAGLAQNIIECYNWLVLNYQPGDKIYCFGFSRGAYTARSLAGFVAELGICKPRDMVVFPEIYNLYEGALYPESPTESKAVTEARKAFEAKRSGWMKGENQTFTIKTQDADGKATVQTGIREPISDESRQVEVVGVWDTVGSLGVPKIFGTIKLPTFGNLDEPGREFHDVRISDNVHHAFHALALDERRKPFAPTLWYVKKDQARPRGSSFKQVWFPGVHINCGGGSDDLLKDRKADFEQIANITFSWMVQQCRDHLAFDEKSLIQAMDDQKALLAALSKEVPSAVPGWGIGTIVDSFSDAGWAIKLGGWEYRQPGQTLQPESIVDKVPKRTTDLGVVTDEAIHPSVFYRMLKLNKRSPALEGWKRQPRADKRNGWEWTTTGADGKPLTLPEYQIEAHDAGEYKLKNVERLLAERTGAGDFLKTLDEMYTSGIDKTKPSDPISKLSV